MCVCVCVCGGGGGVPHVRKPPTTLHSGGTFDVALATVYQDDQGVDYITIIATEGDPFLGGRDFDQKLMEYMVTLSPCPVVMVVHVCRTCFPVQIDLHSEVTWDAAAKARLLLECEVAKKSLSELDEV
jgi:hypothetical protein